MRLPLLLAGLLLATSLPGCSEKEATWHGRDLDATDPAWLNVTMPVGSSVRWDVYAHAGSTMEWDWFVLGQQEIDFELDGHFPEGMQVITSHHGNEQASHWTTGATRLHSFIFANTAGVEVTLWYRLPSPPTYASLYPAGSDPREDTCRSAAGCSVLDLVDLPPS